MKSEEGVIVAKPAPDVRLILFRECKESSDRNILFDSESIQKCPEPKYRVSFIYFSLILRTLRFIAKKLGFFSSTKFVRCSRGSTPGTNSNPCSGYANDLCLFSE